MSITGEEIRSISPEIRQTPTGWLAVSGASAGLRIGVIGLTAQEAHTAFTHSLNRWAELHEQEED
jgi:hypothetical protein